jgi:hypothetical protein
MITGDAAEKPFHRAVQFHYKKHKNRLHQLNSVCNLTNSRSSYTTTMYQSSTCFDPSSNWFVPCVFQNVQLFDCITFSYENSATPASIQYKVKIFFCFGLRFGMDTLIWALKRLSSYSAQISEIKKAAKRREACNKNTYRLFYQLGSCYELGIIISVIIAN